MRGLPSPFIKIYERGRETPHTSLWRYYRGKTFLPELAGWLLQIWPLCIFIQVENRR